MNLALAGCGMSAYGMAGNGQALAKVLKEAQVASRLKNLCQTHALNNGGYVDADALADVFKSSYVNTNIEGGTQKSNNVSTQLAAYYPSNNGAVRGTERSIHLMEGDLIDRYGGIKGKYFSPTGTPIDMRALPYDADLSQYRQFVVVKPFEVEASTIAPAFGQVGLGIQYRSSVSVEILLKHGIIKQVGGN